MRQRFDFNPGKKPRHKFMIQSVFMMGESTAADLVSILKEWWSTSWSRHCWTDRIPPAYWISWYSFLLPSCFYTVGLVSLCFYAQRCSHVGFPVVWCSEGSITDLGIQLTITLSKLITSKVWKEWAIAWLSISIIHVKDLDSRNIRWYLYLALIWSWSIVSSLTRSLLWRGFFNLVWMLWAQCFNKSTWN